MVSRRNHLEILYANKSKYWVQQIKDSNIKPPFYIQDIIMSPDKQTMLTYSSNQRQGSSLPDYFTQQYTYLPDKNEWKKIIDYQDKPDKNNTFMTFNSHGKIIRIKVILQGLKNDKVDFSKQIETYSSPYELKIKMPRSLFFNELFDHSPNESS